MSDSDMSDFECDMSVEKQLESFKNSYRLDNQNNNDYYNNRNSKNNNYDERNSNHKIDNCDSRRNSNTPNDVTNLSRVETMLKNALESPTSELPPPMDDGEDDVDFLSLGSSSHTDQESSDDHQLQPEDPKTPIDKYTPDSQTEIIACDLQTYLKRYNETGRYINLNKLPMLKKSPTSPNEPPDILVKSTDSLNKVTLDTVAVKPDILQMVDSADENRKRSKNTVCYDFEQKVSSRDKGFGSHIEEVSENRTAEKDDHCQWSITPVDIVGNFEQEVQREFGLLMSGYKNSSNSIAVCSTRPSEGNDYVTSNMHEKVSLAPIPDCLSSHFPISYSETK